MGIKLIIVGVLALVMTVPAIFVGALIDDRTSRAARVTQEISSRSGGRQTFLGPTLAIPYRKTFSGLSTDGIYLAFPAVASATLKTVTEERRRSLFKVPVFQADLKLDAAFDLTGVPAAAPEGAELDWDRAEIVVGVSDARGALTDAMVSAEGKSTPLAPAATAADLTIGQEQRGPVRLILFGAGIDAAKKPGARFSVTSSLRFSGAQRIALLSYGKSTRVTAQGDWPNPGFDGGFLPVRYTTSHNGFTAEWSVPFIARGVRAEGPVRLFAGLDATELGISFIEVADRYQSVSRSLKYILLFLGLVFISYFIFEVMTGKRVHPAQYTLVGVAQIIFYLLLLSLAERIGFDWGFLIAATATIALLSANAGWVFLSRKHGIQAWVTFTLLYTAIYFMLRIEDNALLVGAVAGFLAVAAAMYLTRKIDWYSTLGSTETADRPSS
jgi:inner membrane protein